MTKQELRTTLLLAGIYMSRMLGLFLIFPTFSVLAQNLNHATPEKIGLALGIYSLAQAALQIPMGWLSDVIGRKKVLYAGLVLFFIGSLIATSTNDLNLLIFARLIQGMGAVSAVCLAYIGDTIPGREQGKAMMIVGMAIGSAFMLAFIIGALVSQHWGLSGLFMLTSLFALVALMFAITLPEPPQILSSFDAQTFKTTLFNGSLIVVNVQIALLHMTLSASFFLLPLLLPVMKSSSSYLIAYIIPLLITAIVVAPLVRNRDRGVAHLPYFWLVFAVALLLMATLPFFTSPVLMIMVMVLFFCGFTLIETLLPARLFQFAAAQSRGTTSGIFSLYQFSGNFFGGLLGAKCYTLFVTDGTIQTAFYVLTIPSILMVLLSSISINKQS